MAQYKCFKSDFDSLQKRINRITKKLDKYNKKWTFEVISESIEAVDVYKIDYTNHCKSKYNTISMDVITYNFEMEELKLGNYTAIAVIEHNAVITSNDRQENIIHKLDDNAIVPEKYRTVKSICEHCNSDRQRNKTVLLMDQEGDIKQVGTTCIKEYTGIDAADTISLYADIHDITLQDLEINFDGFGFYTKYRYNKTEDYLTACIQIITQKGYNKESTKYEAWDITGSDLVKTEYKETAKKIIEYFTTNNFDNDFLKNTKTYVTSEYAKISGFIAYAYLAYQKQIEYDKKKQAETEQKAQSDYMGKVGEKIITELTLQKSNSYETSYNGYNTVTQYIHIFSDNAGNVYKWKTSKPLTYEDEKQNLKWYELGEKLNLKGTIKGHEEYNGQKQTELTRCKIQ